MPTLVLKMPFTKNDLVVSVEELKALYFHGVKVLDENGNQLPALVWEQYIKEAQSEVEGLLVLKLQKQIVSETRAFNRDQYLNWNYIGTTFPVNEISHDLEGWLGNVKQIKFPKEWLTIKRGSDPEKKYRQVHLVPNSTYNGLIASNITGLTTAINFMGLHNVPDYWKITYCTGFDSIPADIMGLIGKLAAIKVFHIAGDLILGAGIASSSMSIDSLSQSVSTTSSATNAGYGARILGYAEDIKTAIPRLVNKYKGITLTSV